MDYIAHINEYSGEKQTVADHCRNTACIAAMKLKDCGFEKTAYLAGLLHDFGKYTEKFREYIIDAAMGKNVVRGSVNHTFAGVRYILDKYHNKNSIGVEDILAEIIAFVIGSHHGIFDIIGEDSDKNGFAYRQRKDDIDYDEANKNFLCNCATENEIERLFVCSRKELVDFTTKIKKLCQDRGSLGRSEMYFYYGALCRLILSAVVEGDRKDTAEFMQIKPQSIIESIVDWKCLCDRLENKLGNLKGDTPIAEARQEISKSCALAAEKEDGIYRLNVPTGGGKTLSSLRYALAHAAKFKKKRIIFTMPLLSIIEQNAAVIKEFLDDNGEIVLEHHSNVMLSKEGEELDRHELLIENWNAPIIVTTMVQILYTFFKDKMCAVRRFHTLCDSVLVIDEVQTVPFKMLSLFDLVCNFLTKICNCTIVLCSATQPCFEKAVHPICPAPLELINLSADLLKVFDRVKLHNVGMMDKYQIADFGKMQLDDKRSILIICNTKKEAAEIFSELVEEMDDNIEAVFLSASLCTVHRHDVIDKLRLALQKEKKVLCVSTQVIEAGVDISFDCVIRLYAGMDNIIQAAGRCNRNGENNAFAPVYIVDYIGENLAHLPEIKAGKDATIELLAEFERDAGLYSDNLMSDEAIGFYYRKLFASMKQGYQDFYKRNKDLYVYKLFADNFDNNGKWWRKYFLQNSLKTGGKEFEVFENDAVDVIVPYNEGKKVIEDICSDKAKYDMAYLMHCLDMAKGYTVSLFKYNVETLQREGGLIVIGEGRIFVLDQRYYDDNFGVMTEPKTVAEFI